MSSRSRRARSAALLPVRLIRSVAASLAIAFVLLAGSGISVAQTRTLKVCADPDNLPFSNSRQQGFENRIAQLAARSLHATLAYEWQRMGRGFVREFLDKSVCDVLIGIPQDFRPVLTTSPYYRSTYVFVFRHDGRLQPASLDDPALRGLKIGVQALPEQYAPPADALARRGLQSSIVGFPETGKDAGAILQAVSNRSVDAAIVWGPIAGYYAAKLRPPLQLTPVTPEVDPPGIRMTFAISMGVRKGNTALREELEAFLRQHQPEIQQILADYRVPQLELAPSAADAQRAQAGR